MSNLDYFQVMSFELLLPAIPPYSIIMEVDWNGKILNSWHSNSPSLKSFSDAKVIVSVNLSTKLDIILVFTKRFFYQYRMATCTLVLPTTSTLAESNCPALSISSSNQCFPSHKNHFVMMSS